METLKDTLKTEKTVWKIFVMDFTIGVIIMIQKFQWSDCSNRCNQIVNFICY